MGYGDDEGSLAVRLARGALDGYVAGRRADGGGVPPRFLEPAGAFVTLVTYPDGELRGCMGYPRDDRPLIEALDLAAREVVRDPRFPPLGAEELEGVTVEVSLLGPLEPLRADRPLDLPRGVRVGEDGLFVVRGLRQGLLLPQVAADGGWDAAEFLAQACLKAGLLPDAWFEPDVRIFRFQADVFGERRPRGPAVRRTPGGRRARP